MAENRKLKQGNSLVLLVLLLGITIPVSPFNLYAANNNNVNVSIDSVTIQIPTPNGYIDSSKEAPKLNDALKTVSNDKRFLVGFVTKADAKSSSAGNVPELNRYFRAETLSQFEKNTFSKKDFNDAKKFIREKNAQLVPLTKNILEENATNVIQVVKDEQLTTEEASLIGSAKVGEVRSLGIFNEDEYSISLTTITKYSAFVKDKQTEVLVSETVTSALIKGKFLIFHVVADATIKDIQWVQQATKEWIKTVLDANK